LHHEISDIPAIILHPHPHPSTTAQSNPFQLLPHAPNAPVPTQTIAARTVFHEAQAAIRPLIAGIQTQEQLDALLDSFQGIQLVILLHQIEGH
jgi:hypothetical protein